MLERLAARITINAAIIALLVAALVVQTVRIEGFKIWPISIQGLKAELADEKDARRTDRESYARAQAEAKAKNLEHIRKIEQRQKEISDALIADLNGRLGRIARELRDNPAAKGSAGRTPIPDTGPAPCRAFDPAWLCLSPADRLLGAENEERHDRLIDWVLRQSRVNPND